jgi:hypothetical protein
MHNALCLGQVYAVSNRQIGPEIVILADSDPSVDVILGIKAFVKH